MTRPPTAKLQVRPRPPNPPLIPSGSYREQKCGIFGKMPSVGVLYSKFVFVGGDDAFPGKRSGFRRLQWIVTANACHPAINRRGAESVEN